MGGYSAEHRKAARTLRQINEKLERVEQYIEMVREGSTVSEIAEEMGLTERQVGRLANMSTEIQYAALKTGQTRLEDLLHA